MPNRVEIACWKHGHISELFLTRKGEEKLVRQIPKLKAVCPKCKELENGNEPIMILDGETRFSTCKPYRCHHGHLNVISVLGETLHVRFSRTDFVNVDGSIEELPELIDSKDISCNHVSEKGKRCNCKLKAANKAELTKNTVHSIRTKTRIGDLWDKAGIEPVTPSRLNKKSGEFEDSRTDKANRERLKRLQRGNKRNVDASRQPGQRIERPTDTDYGRKGKGQVNPDRLTR